MKGTSFISTIAGAALIVVTSTFALVGGAHAAEVPTDGANCGLNANQIGNGFICTADVSTTNKSRVIGGGSRCQDATITTTVYRSYNHRGNLMEDRTVVTEPVELDWGPSYPIGGGCNYPTA